MAFYDTAGSVKQLMETGERKAAAIASEAAADYGAEILQRDIEDNPENYTRFFLVRKAGEAETSRNWTTEIGRTEQDEHRIYAGKPAGVAGSGAERIKRDGHQPDQNRVAARAWQAVGIHFLRRLPDWLERGRHAALDALRAHCGMVKELGRYREAQTPNPAKKAAE